MNVWNLIFFCIISFISYVLGIVSGQFDKGEADNSHDPANSELYWKFTASQIAFYLAQYLFAMYMDFFLLYLILKFTSEN